MKKRGIVVSDLHCGHACGLTPPAWQTKEVNGTTTKHNKWARLQRQLWDHYKRMIDELGPFHFGLYVGDGIDGTGRKSGGTELITTDREEQSDMAIECLNAVLLNARRGFEWVGVYGTGYHTGNDEDWENRIAERAGFKKIGAHEWVDVNGCVFDLKHKIGSSTIPHGRHTATAKERMWNILWNHEDALQPDANVFLRGHVHYHAFCGGPGWVAMTLPALQGMGTKYGARQCTGLVDWGVTVFDVADDGAFDWHAETVKIESQKAKAVVL